MNWLRNILGLTARDQRIAELEQTVKLSGDRNRDLNRTMASLRDAYEQVSQNLSAIQLPHWKADETHNWADSDRAAWRGILLSPLGSKLIAVSKAAHYRMLRAASEDHFHAGQSVHCARGFEEAIKWLQILSVSADVPAQTNSRAEESKVVDAETMLRASMSPR